MEGLSDLDEGAVEWLTACVLSSTLRRGSRLPPAALLLLLRRAVTSGREDLAKAFGHALGEALDDGVVTDVPAWLSLFAETSRVSDDPRLATQSGEVMTALAQDLGHSQNLEDVERVARAIDACLLAAAAFGRDDIVPAAVDALEHVVIEGYEPGEGIGDAPYRGGMPARTLADQVRTASALLTAFDVTGRLAYAMLAEELMQFARRYLRDAADGGFIDRRGDAPGKLDKPFVLNCEAARVLCRLDALCRDAAYLEAAVVAVDIDYYRDAERALASQSGSFRAHGVDGAIFGIALAEWLAAR